MSASKIELTDKQVAAIMRKNGLRPTPGTNNARWIADAIRYAYKLGARDGVKWCLETSREIGRRGA